MAAKNSSQVIRWIKDIDVVKGLHETNRENIAKSFASWVKDELEIDVDYKMLLGYHDLMFKIMQTQMGLLSKADLTVFSELGDDQDVFNERDKRALHGRDRVIRLRKKVEGMYGDDFAVKLGLHGETPREPAGLAQLLQGAELVVKGLDALPAPLEPEDPFYTKDGLLKVIRSISAPLEEIKVAVQKEKSETQQAQIKRRKGFENINSLYQLFIGLNERVAKTAGLNELADRLRITAPSKQTEVSTPSEPQKP